MLNVFSALMGALASSLSIAIAVFFAFITSGPMDDMGAYAAFLIPFMLMLISFLPMFSIF